MNRQILETFQQYLLGLSLNGIPVKALGRTFDPPNDQKYLELIHIPNDPDDKYIDGSKMYQGIFRLILHWPNNDEGVYDPLNIVDFLSAQFTKENPLWIGAHRLEFYQRARFLGQDDTGQDILFPLSVYYRCFQPS